MALTAPILPACSLVERGRISALCKNEYQHRLLTLGVLTPQELLARRIDAGHRSFTGRGFLISLPLEDTSGLRVVVKQCLRGGLIRHLQRDIFCGGNRPFDEMRASQAIVERGIKTAEVIAAVKEQLSGPFYRAYLFSLELSGCIDFTSYLNLLKDKTLRQRFRAKAGIFEAVAAAFTVMHRSGVYHRDLHLKNVLLRETAVSRAPEVFIIDFDRAVVKTRLRPAEKLDNLMRFNRSIEKYRFFRGVVTRGDQMRLCRAYLADNEDAARVMPAALRRYRLQLKLHRLTWGLRQEQGVEK